MGYPLQRRGRTELNYMKGPDDGIHPLANGGGKGLKTSLREDNCMPIDSVSRVCLNKLTIRGAS